jgi:hypothetical protein
MGDKKDSFFSVKEDKDEQKEFETGPLSILMQSVKQNTQVRVYNYLHYRLLGIFTFILDVMAFIAGWIM